MTIRYVVHLPFPPSVNALHRAARGRIILSSPYREWKAAADAMALAQKLKIGKPLRKFSAQIALSDAHRGRRDVDNHAKAVLDWAQSRGMILNDRHADRVVVSWEESASVPEGCRLELVGEI